MIVQKLVDQTEGLQNLAGEMLATIVLNTAKGYITTVNPERFHHILEMWRRKLSELQ